MMKNILLLAAFAITPLLFSQDASAQCASGYHHGAYRAPVVSYRAVPHYSHRGHVTPYHSGYRSSGFSYGTRYGSPYRYGSRYGGYGSRYYGRGTSIGINRGGVSLYYGF